MLVSCTSPEKRDLCLCYEVQNIEAESYAHSDYFPFYIGKYLFLNHSERGKGKVSNIIYRLTNQGTKRKHFFFRDWFILSEVELN